MVFTPVVLTSEHRTSNRGHGRCETRTCRVIDLTARSEAPLPHRCVAFRIERERRIRTTGKVQYETVHGLTSLPAQRATPEAVPKLVRGHWSIENRLHHVRDVSSLPGAHRPSPAQPRMPDQPRHLHRAHPGTLRLSPPKPTVTTPGAPARPCGASSCPDTPEAGASSWASMRAPARSALTVSTPKTRSAGMSPRSASDPIPGQRPARARHPPSAPFPFPVHPDPAADSGPGCSRPACGSSCRRRSPAATNRTRTGSLAAA